MKFKYRMSPIINVILYAVIALQLAVLFILIAKFAEWFNFVSQNLAFEIVEVVVCLLIIACDAMLLSTRYVVEQGKLKVKYGLLDLTNGRFAVSNILALVQRQSDNKLYMNVIENNQPSVIALQLSAKDYHPFYDCLYKENPKIEYLEDK